MSLNQRSSGILLPISSLPGTPFVGALGQYANKFADFLSGADQHFWQLLPINPIDQFHSPYSSRSAFAGEALYIDLNEFLEEGLLESNDFEINLTDSETTFPQASKLADSEMPIFQSEEGSLNYELKNEEIKADQSEKKSQTFFPSCSNEKLANYEAAFRIREPLWRKAFVRFQQEKGGQKYRTIQNEFRKRTEFWLDDFAAFETLSHHFGTSQWTYWDSEYRHPNNPAVKEFVLQYQNEVEFFRFLQLVFDVQWREFREYCHSKNLELLGDVPIYVGHASADTWSHPELFQLNQNGKMIRVAGVPSDDFNPDGQRWNSPLYDWQKHQETGFEWFVQRLKTTLERFDDIRLDHFIGYYNYYSFPELDDKTNISDDKNQKVNLKQGVNSELNIAESKTEKVNQFGQTEKSLEKTLSDQTLQNDHSLNVTNVYEDGWLPGPQEKLFDVLFQHFPASSFLAEDLGVMNKGVHQLRDHYNLPGMFVLQFVFDEHKPEDGDPSQYWTENSVACTGTHDTPPVLAWLAGLEKKGLNPLNAWTTFDYVWSTLRSHRKKDEALFLDFETYPELYGMEYNGWHYSLPQKTDHSSLNSEMSSSPILTQSTGIPLESPPIRSDIHSLRKAAIRLVMNSRSNIALFPIQDILGLGDDARMNFPGYANGNWLFRVQESQLTFEVQQELKQLTKEGNRILCGKQN